MKKLFTLLCLSAMLVNAQPYGEKLYSHANSICSSGGITAIHSAGFMMAGYAPTATTGNPNFFIDKTGSGGLFSPPATSFSKSYIVQGTQSCGALTQASTMAGVTMLEAFGASAWWYAVAGAYDQGIFFTALTQSGTVFSQKLYVWNGTFLNPTKPIIIQGVANDMYYICGSFNNGTTNIVYILWVDANGGLLNSSTYAYSGLTKSLTATDFLLSPYTPVGSTELVVVGKTQGSNVGTRGFAMRVDAFSLSSVLSFNEFGHAPGVSGQDLFGCITPDNTNGGFAIGGSSNLSASGNVWALNVNSTCSSVNWSNNFRPLNDPVAGPMVDIIQRQSSVYGNTFYGAVASVKGMLVLKLNQAGGPFTSGTPIDNFNEFLYNGTTSPISSITALSYINNTGPSSDVGLHVYGTKAGGSTAARHHFVEAAFNGDSDMGAGGCTISTKTVGLPAFGTNVTVVSGSVNILAPLTSCNSINIQPTTLSTTPITMCQISTLPPNGSNNRLATGIAEQSENSVFKVSPNPVSDQLNITFTAAENDAIEIKMFDYLGRLISVTPSISYNSGAATATIEMSRLSVESGVYMIRTTINGVTNTQKIIYTKGQ